MSNVEYKYVKTVAGRGKGTEMYNLKIGSDGSVEGTYKSEPIKIIMIRGRKHVNNHHWPIYRLVWEAFNGPVPKGYVIHHIDHNKLNDRLDNLMIMTDTDHLKHHFNEDNNPNKGLHWYNNKVNNKRFKNDIEAFAAGYFFKGKKYSPRKNKEGYIPWNKGLTKETDERVAKYGETRRKNQENNVTKNEIA